MSVRQENKGRKSDDVCIVELTLAISRKKRGKSVRKRKTLLDDISNLSERRLDSYFFRNSKNVWVPLRT